MSDPHCQPTSSSNQNQQNMEENVLVEITGLGIPDAVSFFTDIYVDPVLKDNITKSFKNASLTTFQRYALPVLEVGHDLMACAPTRSGKTVTSCVSIINGAMKTRSKSIGSFVLPVALILCPTEELSFQVFEEAKKFCHQTGIKVAYGGGVVDSKVLKKAENIDILVATPQQICILLDERKSDKPSVSLKKIKYLAFDEADQMLMEFQNDIERIVNHSDMSDARQTMLFSATLPDEIQRLASVYLSDYIFLSVGGDFCDIRSKTRDSTSEFYDAIYSLGDADNAATFGGATSGVYDDETWNTDCGRGGTSGADFFWQRDDVGDWD